VESADNDIKRKNWSPVRFNFKSVISRPLALHVGFKREARGMRWVCDMIMSSLQTRIEKSFSYSISYLYSNLKFPNKVNRTTIDEKFI